MKIIVAINGYAIPNFVLEADSKKKKTPSKPRAIQQNVCIYLLSSCLISIVREARLCCLAKVIDRVYAKHRNVYLTI